MKGSRKPDKGRERQRMRSVKEEGEKKMEGRVVDSRIKE